MTNDILVQPMPWQDLTQFTSARIALGRVGVSLPTDEVLKFGLAHAQARDAVHTPFDIQALATNLQQQGFNCLQVASQALNRQQYLQRPDLGRQLADASEQLLLASPAAESVCIVIADGLSAAAVHHHAYPLLMTLREQWPELSWPTVPIVLASQARVALGDAVGAALRASLVIMLIGERPGLSSPDSLGAYLTFSPRIGRSDAERNCISNIRLQGLSYAAAAHKINWLSQQALSRQLSGVLLKDDSDDAFIANKGSALGEFR